MLHKEVFFYTPGDWDQYSSILAYFALDKQPYTTRIKPFTRDTAPFDFGATENRVMSFLGDGSMTGRYSSMGTLAAQVVKDHESSCFTCWRALVKLARRNAVGAAEAYVITAAPTDRPDMKIVRALIEIAEGIDPPDGEKCIVLWAKQLFT